MKPLLLSRYGCCVKVRDRKLVLYDQSSGRRREWFPVEFPYDSILVENLGGFVTFPALRWLAANGVTLSVVSYAGQLLASYLPEVPLHPHERLAQLAAYLDCETRTGVARYVLESKLGHVPRFYQTVTDLLTYEAREAVKFYAGLGVTRDYPHARDAANACLNYAFGLLASRARLAVHRACLEPSIGFLHAPRAYSSALVWDVMEPFRAETARVALAVKRELRANSYADDLGGGLRLRPEGARALVQAFAQAFHEDAMGRFVRRLTLRFSSPHVPAVLEPLSSPGTGSNRRELRTGGRMETLSLA